MESNTNKNLNDEQLDDLIRQSFHRQQTIDEINVSVMTHSSAMGKDCSFRIRFASAVIAFWLAAMAIIQPA